MIYYRVFSRDRLRCWEKKCKQNYSLVITRFSRFLWRYPFRYSRALKQNHANNKSAHRRSGVSMPLKGEMECACRMLSRERDSTGKTSAACGRASDTLDCAAAYRPLNLVASMEERGDSLLSLSREKFLWAFIAALARMRLIFSREGKIVSVGQRRYAHERTGK